MLVQRLKHNDQNNQLGAMQKHGEKEQIGGVLCLAEL